MAQPAGWIAHSNIWHHSVSACLAQRLRSISSTSRRFYFSLCLSLRLVSVRTLQKRLSPFPLGNIPVIRLCGVTYGSAYATTSTSLLHYVISIHIPHTNYYSYKWNLPHFVKSYFRIRKREWKKRLERNHNFTKRLLLILKFLSWTQKTCHILRVSDYLCVSSHDSLCLV
jgi:hypothetical protein